MNVPNGCEAADAAVPHTSASEFRSGIFEVSDFSYLRYLPTSPTRDSNFAALYREQRNVVLRTLRRSGVPACDVDDAAQEVFIIFFCKFSSVDPPGVSPLLRAIALRVGANYQRRFVRKARRATMGSPELAGIALKGALRPDEAAARGEERAFIARALNRLNRSKRETVVLADLEGLTMSEIAERTHVGPPTVASRLRVGRAKVARWVRMSVQR